MNYWIFKSNPKNYRLEDRLKEEPNPATVWSVIQHKEEIRRGDIAFIWVTGTPRGICSVLQIESDPGEMEDLTHEKKYALRTDFGSTLKVKGTITHRFHMINTWDLQKVPGLENLSVFHGYQMATNFPVTNEEGETLLEIINHR